jgi:hypothetical protein
MVASQGHELENATVHARVRDEIEALHQFLMDSTCAASTSRIVAVAADLSRLAAQLTVNGVDLSRLSHSFLQAAAGGNSVRLPGALWLVSSAPAEPTAPRFTYSSRHAS